MQKLVILFLAAGLGCAPAQAQKMPASTFLTIAEGLNENDTPAIFSTDLRVLRREANRSFEYLEAEATSARNVGHDPAYCEPPKTSLGSREIVAYLRSIPVEQRSMPIKQALRSLMQKKFPC